MFENWVFENSELLERTWNWDLKKTYAVLGSSVVSALWDCVVCNGPGYSVHGILQEGILDCVYLKHIVNIILIDDHKLLLSKQDWEPTVSHSIYDLCECPSQCNEDTKEAWMLDEKL